ncbi:hypothetical protein [Aureimonas psammosilenae]|uniref:hypothetical protein n=1 Tax=Aureimonas psammosilenae TaxID=2495496 RepID=UPI001260773D|nr:hypothetical protein [Aureimonas psammosilenae]
MPYWNKYPTRDRIQNIRKPSPIVTSRGMGVAARYATSLRENAEIARLAAELDVKLAEQSLANQNAKGI